MCVFACVCVCGDHRHFFFKRERVKNMEGSTSLHYSELCQLENGKLVPTVLLHVSPKYGLPSGFLTYGEDNAMVYHRSRAQLMRFIQERNARLLHPQDSSLRGKSPTPLFRGEYEFKYNRRGKETQLMVERFVVYATPFIYIDGWTLSLNRWQKPKDFPDDKVWSLPKKWYVCASGAKVTIGYSRQSAIRSWKLLFGDIRFETCEEVPAFTGELSNYSFQDYKKDHPSLFEESAESNRGEQKVEVAAGQ